MHFYYDLSGAQTYLLQRNAEQTKNRSCGVYNMCAHQKQTKKRDIWVRQWLEKRQSDGAHQTLLKEFRSVDNQKYLFRNFLRMDENIYDELLMLVSPLIQKQDTSMRIAISPSERLSVTLRYLAIGGTFASLSVLFRIAPCTISTIIPETCDAIYQVLKDKYLKVYSIYIIHMHIVHHAASCFVQLPYTIYIHCAIHP